jgi:hypothetical protein
MGLDVRIPLGLMFLVSGAMLGLYGLFTRGSAIYQRSLGIDINLIWGVLMFAFGLVVYILGRRPGRTARSHPADEKRHY